jgi:hypothetical protein
MTVITSPPVFVAAEQGGEEERGGLYKATSGFYTVVAL